MKINISERALDILEWDSILKELCSRCETSTGRGVAASLKPLIAEEIQNQLKEISELKEMIIKNEIPDFSGITDIESLVEIAKKGGLLSIDELFRIKSFIIGSNRIIGYINKNREEINYISKKFCNLNKLTSPGDLLIASITDNKELSASRYPELKSINDKIFNAKQDVEKRLQKLIYSPSMDKILQEKIFTTRNERYVILIKSNMKGRIKGTVHDLSSSGATYYLEPDEITGLNNQLISLHTDLQIEINRILRMLSKEVGIYSDEIMENLNSLARFDFLTAASKFSISIKGNGPEISQDYIIDLHNARHPLLYLMSPDTVVPNDISLGNEYNCLIISGANTGGKTVLLKTIGLCALLIMHGLHIPAGADSRIGIFSNILADIGDDQSILQSLSSYSGQIVIINEMIKRSDRKSLALIDEIIVGTNPRQGAVLAQSILETLITTNAKIVVTTHYSELKELASIDNRFMNASVSFDINTLKPTYRLITGLPGTSYAIEIARIYGISEKILSRSKELLDSREMTTEALIESIQKHREEIEEERINIELLQEQLSEEKNRCLDLQTKLKHRMENIKNERGIEFLEEIKRHKNDIARKIKELQKQDIKSAGTLQQDIIKIEDKIRTQLKRDSMERLSDKYLPFDPNNAEVGDMVLIAPIEKEGKIEAIDVSDKSVRIILGSSIKTRYKFKDILIPISKRTNRAKPGAGRKIKDAPVINKKSVIPKIIQTSFNTIDLRGLKVDEAIFKLEDDFDRMIIGGIKFVVIIHGHGAGALKKAVRNRLKFSPYVTNFRPGEYGEGGDGVSIALLRD